MQTMSCGHVLQWTSCMQARAENCWYQKQVCDIELLSSDVWNRPFLGVTSRTCKSLIITPRIVPGGAAQASNVSLLRSMGKTWPALALLRANPPRNSHTWKASPVCGAKRVLKAAVCCIPVWPSLTEIQPVGSYPFFSECSMCAYSGEYW